MKIIRRIPCDVADAFFAVQCDLTTEINFKATFRQCKISGFRKGGAGENPFSARKGFSPGS